MLGRFYMPTFSFDNILGSSFSMMWNFTCVSFKHNTPTLFKKMNKQVRDVSMLMKESQVVIM